MTEALSPTERIQCAETAALFRRARQLAIREWNKLPPSMQAMRTLDSLIVKHARKLERQAKK